MSRGRIVSHGWDIEASLEEADGRKFIRYRLLEGIYTSETPLSSIGLFCIDACKLLLRSVEQDEDRVFIEHEIALLRRLEVEWRTLQDYLNKIKPSR